MIPYQHIIFDIDGTLIDTENALLHSLQDTLKQLDLEVPGKNQLKFVLGIPGETALHKLGVTNPQEGNMLWNDQLEKYKNEIKLFNGISDLIKKLFSENYNLGLITSKNHSELEQDFSPMGLADYFKIIVCSEDSLYPKPSPYPMLKYLELAGIKNNEALYIGDTIYDMQCAAGAGVAFGLALWGCSNPEKIKADYYFKTPSDVIQIAV